MDWVASLKMKVLDTKFRDRNREPTIYRVPDLLKSVDPQAYEPLLVSLGPYHRHKPHLQAMNQLKWKYLKFILEEKPSMALEDYVDLIKNVETRARDAYSEEVNMSSNSFVEMMLLDGFFVMLTIMERNYPMQISEESTLWTGNVVVRDIFMLENQLPFFLLETLYKSAFPLGVPFRNLALKFIRIHFSTNLKLPTDNDNETFHHIIHLFLSCIDPTTNHGNGNGNQSSTCGYLCTVPDVHVPDLPWIPNATVGCDFGIRFKRKRKQRAKSFLDITFHDEELEIPQLQIVGRTNSLLRNLIAYEQCSTDSKFHVTSYVVLMSNLINTAADVELLQQHEIIIGYLGGSHEIVTLFKKLGANVTYKSHDFYLMDVFTDMRKHYHARFNNWRAMMNRDYFGDPWRSLSIFGALPILVLTMIQTVYAVLSYAQSSH
ncbi:UPF0481 protein At3g47200-like [Zingiber officinale]|nr:UPF0481 protein At3g47200-like [Zingiber officinale]